MDGKIWKGRGSAVMVHTSTGMEVINLAQVTHIVTKERDLLIFYSNHEEAGTTLRLSTEQEAQRIVEALYELLCNTKAKTE